MNKILSYVYLAMFYNIKRVKTIKRTTIYSHPDTLNEIREYCRQNGITMKVIPNHEDTAAVSEPSPLTRCETTVFATDTEFLIHDLVIPIPDRILKMVPVDQIDTGHFQAFPIDGPTSILVMSEEPNYRFTADFGSPSAEFNYNQKTHADIRDHIETLAELSGGDTATTASAQHNDMSLTSVIYPEWDFLVVSIKDGPRISISIPNTRDEKDYAQDTELSVTAACIFARAILLTLRKIGRSIERYNEHDLRSTILSLLFADRS